MKQGWYWVEHEGIAEPAFFDGSVIVHRGAPSDKVAIGENPIMIVFHPDSCPTGCTCTTLPNGSIEVKCPT